MSNSSSSVNSMTVVSSSSSISTTTSTIFSLLGIEELTTEDRFYENHKYVVWLEDSQHQRWTFECGEQCHIELFSIYDLPHVYADDELTRIAVNATLPHFNFVPHTNPCWVHALMPYSDEWPAFCQRSLLIRCDSEGNDLGSAFLHKEFDFIDLDLEEGQLEEVNV